MARLSLVSLNIEQSKHLELVIPFIERIRPDVLCVQELMERDIPLLERALQSSHQVFFPMSRILSEETPAIYGVGIFSRLPVKAHGAEHYVGSPDVVPDSDSRDARTFNNTNRAVLWCDVEKGGDIFRVATTHFTWTPHGEADDAQRYDMRSLLAALESLNEFVLTGDFNAPRGGEIFAELAGRYTDNIPQRYETSIDVNLHRAGTTHAHELNKRMVDGLFTTPKYEASNVELISGISDHMAIAAVITPRP